MGLYHTFFKINGNVGRKQQIFLPRVFNTPLSVFASEFWNADWIQKIVYSIRDTTVSIEETIVLVTFCCSYYLIRHSFNGQYSRTTWVNRCQNVKPLSSDFLIVGTCCHTQSIFTAIARCFARGAEPKGNASYWQEKECQQELSCESPTNLILV